MEFVPSSTEQRILCCQCGTSIAPNPANMCVNCIRNEVDITDGIPKQMPLPYCKNCERYLQPPSQWIHAQLESRELLALCLKKIRGLSKVRLVDAGFIWTEPHSKRIKLKLTIQKEVFASTILQQVFVVDVMVCYQQCEDCMRLMAQNTWKAVVQVRQKVDHKRTFLYLEQLILKHNAHKETNNIKEMRDGLDFFFGNRNQAVKLLDFLQSVSPIRYKSSEQLISHDIHNGTSNYKFTYSVELVPICKDDLVCLPPKLAKQLGNICPLVLCTRVGNALHLTDPNTLQTADMAAQVFWNTPFASLCTYRDLTEFYVLDVEPSNMRRGKWLMADICVARMSDMGTNDDRFFVRSHLGNILKAGDAVYGYDLKSANFNNDDYAALKRFDLPDIVLVKKSYNGIKRRNRGRAWKLKHLNKTVDEGAARKMDLDKQEADYELFLRDLEEDDEMRQHINLYLDKRGPSQQQQQPSEMEETDVDDDERPEVPLEELLEDLQLEDDDDVMIDTNMEE